MYVISRASRGCESAQGPVRSDGSQFPWAILLPGGNEYGWADTVSDLVAVLIADPGYLQMSAHQRLVARISVAIRLMVIAQAEINSRAMTCGDWGNLCEWERQVLNGPRHRPANHPSGFPTRHLFSGADVWTAPVMLLCLSTWTAVPGAQPVVGTSSNLGIIDPVDEWSLLESLAELDIVRIYRHDGP